MSLEYQDFSDFVLGLDWVEFTYPDFWPLVNGFNSPAYFCEAFSSV